MVAVNKQVLRTGNPNFIECVVAYNQAIKKGEMLKIPAAGGNATPVAAASDNDTFFAIADQAHAALAADDSKVHRIRCIIPDPACVFEFPITGTPNTVIGTGLSISDSQTLALAATDHVAVAVEKVTGATTCKVVFLTPPLHGGASKNVSFTSA
jgi:hypothetical protein